MIEFSLSILVPALLLIAPLAYYEIRAHRRHKQLIDKASACQKESTEILERAAARHRSRVEAMSCPDRH